MLTSKENLKFKKLKKLSLKKYRDFYQEFLVFGEHLVEEAFKTKEIVIEIFTVNPSKKGTLISKNLMMELNKNKILYPVCALCKINSQPLKSNKILVLDDIQDPGNAGVLLRSACAFNFSHIFSSKKTVDFYNEKTIKASQGAIFKLFLEKGDIVNFLISAKKKNYTIFSASVNKKNINLENSSFFEQKNKKILIVGNEGAGISPLVQQNSEYFINIDMNQIESLNVGAAGSILMYLLRK